MKTYSMCLSGLIGKEDKNNFLIDSMKMSAYAGAIMVPIAVPLICK